MDVIRNLFSSPRKQPAQWLAPPPPTSNMSPPSKTYSKKDIRRASRGSDRYSLPEGRSPRSRLSNVSSITAAQDTTGDISYTQQQETTITMPPPRRKRTSTGTGASTPVANSSPALRRSSGITSSAARVKSSPRVRSSPPVRSSPRRRSSPILGSSPANRSLALPTIPKPAVNNAPPMRVMQTARASRTSLTKKNTEPKQVEEEAAVEQEQGETRAVLKRIKDFRWNDETNQHKLLIEWEDGEDTWEDEETLHADARKKLIAFWRSKRERPNHSEFYQAFAIRRLDKNKSKGLVEWVGYEQSTWEPVENIDKHLVDAYLERANGKTKAKTKAQPKAKAKPRAKAKAPTNGRTLGRSRVTKR
ncbi:hypothetical protein FSARC_10658 [Fusarium sarcochroum]|uniref:Chromo domain-containing protein n=1 Tax=Fusarium sarcochroum TaxID=1208366 RepID=A0A8H4X3J6_9HYPO|nr:hypothetical protein FSARC_10658 [Fusarium sarcochroum]